MWNIQTFSELPSTQTLARTRLHNGSAKHGDVIVTLHQSEGRGQYLSRVWHDEPGANLLLSATLIDVPPAIASFIQFIGGLAVLSTIRTILVQHISSFKLERVRLKWPNDIWLDDKKISGILSEAVWSASELKGVILGVGINVNQQRFAEPLVGRATSLHDVLAAPVLLETVRDMLLLHLGIALEQYQTADALVREIRKEFLWMQTLDSVGAALPDGSTIRNARIIGVTDTGALHILSSDGVEHTLQTVTLLFE